MSVFLDIVPLKVCNPSENVQVYAFFLDMSIVIRILDFLLKQIYMRLRRIDVDVLRIFLRPKILF